MKPIIIYALSLVAALVFEWAYKFYSARYTVPASKSQWCCFFWVSAFLLCGISIMKPYESKTFVEWTPMFLLAWFHMQQSYQREIVDRLTGTKQGNSVSST